MPRFSQKTDDHQEPVDEVDHPEKPVKTNTFTQVKYWKTVLFMVYVYYCISCGLEGFFQVFILF
jgi:hypothetical protein